MMSRNMPASKKTAHKKTVIYLAVCAALVVSALPATATNLVQVTGAAAIEGSFGLEAVLDGSTNKANVRNYCPGGPSDPPGPCDEVEYRSSFLIDMNNLAMNDLDIFRIQTLRSRSGGPLGLSNRNEAYVHVRYRVGQVNPYKIRMACRNDSGSWVQLDGHSLPPSGVRKVTVEWKAASAPGANDGACRLYVNTSAQADILRSSSETVDNDERAIGEVWLGPDRTAASMVGTYYMDSFESTRAVP